MAVTADSVVVELIAKNDRYDAVVTGSANKADAAFSKIEKASSDAEAAVQRSAAGMSSSLGRAANDIERNSARAANASRNLGRQISDIGVGLTGGQNPFLILSQQAPQVADALADTGGKAARVAAFFAGPWGAALLAAGSALGVLVGKALEGGDTLDGLVAKLEDNAAKARLAEQAEAIFARSLEGAAQASVELNKKLQDQNRSQLQVAQSALAAAQAQRQINLQNARAAQIEANKALSLAQGARDSSNFSAVAGAAGAGTAAASQRAGIAAADARLTTARTALATANRGLAAAESAVVEASVPILRQQAAEQSDKSAAATDRHTRSVDGLTDAYRKAQAAANKLGGAAGNAVRAAAVRTYRAGVADADRTLASDQDAIRDSRKKGPSAETLARRAEAARVLAIRNNEAYNNELEQLQGQIIAALKERAVTAAEAASFARDEIERQFRDRKDNIAADLSAGKYTAAQAAELDERNETARLLRLRNIAIEEDIRGIQESAARDALTLGLEQDKLESDRSISESRAEQKRLDLELVRIKYEQRRIALEALRAAAQTRGDTNAVNDIGEQIDALPGLRRNDEISVEQRNRTPYQRYRRNLSDADFLADSIDAVKVDALEAVTDELTKATTAALGLKGAFGSIVGELIRIGIQRKLIGPLADALFGKADGSSGTGALGGIFKSIASGFGGGGGFGGGFGRASGGYVGPGQTVRVNEGRSSGVELLRMGPQGGTIIPLGQTRAAQRGRGVTILQTIAVDARGAVMNDQFASQILARAGQSAQELVSANNGAIRKGLPAAQARYDQLGTT